MINALLEFGELPPEFDRERFAADIKAVVHARKGQVIAHATGRSRGANNEFERFVNQLFQVAYRHRIHVPASTTVLIKSLVTIEGVARSLDPELNMVNKALPVVFRSLLPRWLRWR